MEEDFTEYKVLTKKCCPNGCPDLASVTETLDAIRSDLKIELLKSKSQPIGFEQADEGFVLASIHDHEIMAECGVRLVEMLLHIGINEAIGQQVIQELTAHVTGVSSYEELDMVGFRWHQEFVEKGFTAPIDDLMMERNHWVAGLIAPKLVPGTVLDHDSGDSYVARFIQEQRSDVVVHTQDAFDFRREVRDLPIVFYDYETKQLPYAEAQFDNAILVTVLHHCDEPEKMFDEVARSLKKGGRLFLFENVFIKGDLLERGVNIFFDWFFNKILHQGGLPLPFTHFCRDQWREFLNYKGFTIIEANENLGQWPSVPLKHVLYVTEKK